MITKYFYYIMTYIQFSRCCVFVNVIFLLLYLFTGTIKLFKFKVTKESVIYYHYCCFLDYNISVLASSKIE